MIPIQPGTKQPSRLIENWTGFCDNLPKQETRNTWLREYCGHGIGLCLGTRVSPETRIGAVDVDDEIFVGVMFEVLGASPCAKRGKKGITNFVRFPHDADLKSTKITTYNKEGAIDILLGGRMTVLPPTVHPETWQSYVWR